MDKALTLNLVRGLHIAGHLFDVLQEDLIPIFVATKVTAGDVKHLVAADMNELQIMTALLVKTDHLVDNRLDQLVEWVRLARTDGGRIFVDLPEVPEFGQLQSELQMAERLNERYELEVQFLAEHDYIGDLIFRIVVFGCNLADWLGEWEHLKNGEQIIRKF